MFFYRNLISVAPHTHVIRSVTYHFLVNERKLPLTARSRAKWQSTQRSLSICFHNETEAKIKHCYQCVLNYYLVSPQLRHGKALNASGMLLPSPHKVCASIDPHCASPKHTFLSSRIPNSIRSSKGLEWYLPVLKFSMRMRLQETRSYFILRFSFNPD